ncbi:DUF1801 domain-containing protein [Runella sp.]|uniref:DUF1801 domain-containing protein n=1 Tax=Runella sp. TaxID=1960881 RepID=UPI003D0C8150
MREIDTYFLEKAEPAKSCLLFLRSYLLNLDSNIRETWKYSMPVYCYNEKMFCYLWTQKKSGQPYIGIVEGNKIHHPLLIQEKRTRMKILLLEPAEDLPIEILNAILNETLNLYRSKL